MQAVASSVLRLTARQPMLWRPWARQTARFASIARPLRASHPLRGLARPGRRAYSQQQAPPPQGKKEPSIFQKYGAAALTIYLGLSLLDLSACFIAVHNLPAETLLPVMKKMKQIMNYVYEAIGLEPSPEPTSDSIKPDDRSLWTELIIAYGIHKLLNVVRLPLTAAITPAIVKSLAKRGYRIPGTKLPSEMAK